MFEPFQQFLNKAASHYGVTREVEAAKICQQFRTLLPKIFTNQSHPEDHIQPRSYKDHTLIVKVENSAWAQEVIMRKEKIINEMNTLAGQKIIKNLRAELR